MANRPKSYYLLVLLGLIFTLSGCELSRNSSGGNITEPPPTLAPLGAEGSNPINNATAIPTVIYVPPTATVSSLPQQGSTNNPNEPKIPTSQPVNLASTMPAATANRPAIVTAIAVTPGITSSVAKEPISTSVTAESIIVNATTKEPSTTPPIAANPPASKTSGNYSAPSAQGNTYTVQTGDTLFGISQHYGKTVEAIMSVNGLTSDLVYVGQVLTIPTQGSNASAPVVDPASPNNGVHTVASGETLFSIATSNGLSVETLAMANNLPYPYIIYPGQQLTIPTEAAHGNTPSQSSGDNTHTVAPGETLYSIARIYGTTAEAIAAANGLSDPNQIYVGQVLYLP